MTLHELIKELIDISSQKLQIALNKYNEILAYRTAFRNSLRNTINKEIENSCDSSELNKLIFTFENQLEKSFVIALYRRYLWLEPTNTIMYHKFVDYLREHEQDKQILLVKALQTNDFDSALTLVEEIFDNTFATDKTLIRSIDLRTLVDIANEYFTIDVSPGIPSMNKTNARQIREYYLKEKMDERINNPNVNIIELREFFTTTQSLYIILPCELGLAVGRKYFNLNKADRELYAHFCNFLNFWNLGSAPEILQFVAVNDFDNALRVVNSIIY